eukprot:634034-Hanusia_phi.AAC.1
MSQELRTSSSTTETCPAHAGLAQVTQLPLLTYLASLRGSAASLRSCLPHPSWLSSHTTR